MRVLQRTEFMGCAITMAIILIVAMIIFRDLVVLQVRGTLEGIIAADESECEDCNALAGSPAAAAEPLEKIDPAEEASKLSKNKTYLAYLESLQQRQDVQWPKEVMTVDFWLDHRSSTR